MDEILDFIAIEPLNKIVIQQPIYQKAVRKVTGLSNETISKLTTISCKLFIQLTLLYFLSIIQGIVYLLASILLSIAELIMGIINWFFYLFQWVIILLLTPLKWSYGKQITIIFKL